MEETELRERLGFIAARTSPPLQDPGDLTAAVVDRHLGQQRRKRALGALAAALAVIVVAVPVVVSLTGQDTGPAAPASSSAAVYATTTRGSLAGENFFVDGVRRLPWTGGPAGDTVPEPPLDSRHVVFAGTFSFSRWVLVAGADPDGPLPPDEDGDGRRDLDQLDSVLIAWFRGPEDATPEEMTPATEPRIVAADEPTSLTESARGGLVIVAAPGDRIEMSGRAMFEQDGTPRREYEPVSDWNGVVVRQDVPIASFDRAMRYRVIRGGNVVTGTYDTIPNADFRLPDVDFARLRPAPPAAPGDAAVPAAIDDLFGRTGVSFPFVEVSILWAGDLPARDGRSARLSLLAVLMPDDGPYYVTGALGWDQGGGQVATASCGSEFRPTTTALDSSVFVMRCDATTGAPTDSLVVVAPPTGFPTVRTVTGGQGLDEVAVIDGVGVLPVPPGPFEVEVVDTSGGGLRYDPMGTADLGD